MIAKGATMGATTHSHKEHAAAIAPFYSSFFEALHKEQWKEVRLGEVGTIITGKTPSYNNPQDWGHSTLFITPTDYKNYHKYASDSARKISDIGLKRFAKIILPKNSILVTCIGSDMGKVVMNKFEAITPQQINSIIPNQTINYDFLYYSMVNMYPILKIFGSDGTAVPILNKGDFENLTIPLPPLKVQQQIAEILSSFDDKIDVLHRQNKTLESLALTLFRHTFIDNPNRNEWEEKPLSEIADFLNGLACQKIPPKNEIDRLPVLKIKELREGITESSDWATSEVDSKYIVQNGDIIFSWSASLMVKIWNGQKCILNQHLFKITSAIYPKWFYYFWCLYHLQEFVSIASAQATTMGHIKRQDLDNAICLIPDNQTLHELDKVISPLLLKINNNSQQIQNLQQIRDMLLAKILNDKMEL